MTEKEIIAGCLKKNAACQRMLFDLYARKLMSLCLRYAGSAPDAEDMLQESFVKIFSSIHQYEYKGSFEGWIRKITVNTCLRKMERKNIFTDGLSVLENTSDENWDDAISSLTEKELISLIGKLPEGYRVVFNLYIMEGYSHNEIAEMLKIEPVTSRSQLIKARRILQKQILVSQKTTLKT